MVLACVLSAERRLPSDYSMAPGAQFQFLAYILSPQGFPRRPRNTKQMVERGPESHCHPAILPTRVTDYKLHL